MQASVYSGVGVEPGVLDDVVLQEPVDDDDVAADELLPRPDPLADDLAVMGDDLQVEVGTRMQALHSQLEAWPDVAQPPPEGEVAALDRVLELRAVDRRR